MSTLDFTFAPLAALACFAVYLWLFFKFPTGVVFIGFTTYGIAWVDIGPLNYARAVFLLQALSAAYFLYQVLKTKGTDRILQFLGTKYSILIWFLMIIWVKIGVDILYNGLDEFREVGLKIAAQTIFLPAVVFFMAAVGTDPWRFANGIMVGMVAFSMAFVLPAVPGMIAEGRILSAAYGVDRLTVYNMDTINGGRFFFLGAIGSMALIAAGGIRRIWLLALSVVCGAFVVLLLLNGTRQFIIALVILGMACGYMMIRTSKFLKVALFTVGIGSLVYLAYGIFQSAEVGERFSAEGIAREMSVSRGAIWQRAFEAGISAPFWGVGFRRFGDVTLVPGQSSEADTTADLSGAHGFFQDIWAEHGAIWGIIGFGVFLYSLRNMIRRVRAEKHSVIWSHYMILIALIIPLFMSGAIFSSGGMYLFALSMYVVFAKHKIDTAQEHVERFNHMMREQARKRELAILQGRA